MLAYIQSNYDHPDLLRQSPRSEGVWEGVRFTYDAVDECDLVIVLNHPVKDIDVKCRKGGRILIIQEPPYERNNYLKDYFPFFDVVISGFDVHLKSPENLQIPAMLPWLVNMDYDTLSALPETEKKNKVSWVTSNSDVNPGHKPRLELLQLCQKTNSGIDLFGRGIHPLKNKEDGLLPYQYTLAVENYSANDYWTEKIADAFLTRTMPFYYGCRNIEKYFPEGSFVRIDIQKPEQALEIIRDAMAQDLYTKNKAAIEEARQLVLNKYQFFPAVTSLIEKYNIGKQKKIRGVIPANGQPQGLLKKVKSFIGKL